MQEKGSIAFMLMLTGLMGCQLFDAMRMGGGILTAGLFGVGRCLKNFTGVRHAEGKLDRKRIGIHRGRQRRAVQVSERRARLEALRTRAHFLAGTCQDTYGAQRCCLEIISQTEKDDPLFMEACDLYMRTVTSRSRRMPDSRHRIPSNPFLIEASSLPAAANVIPFPLAAERH